MQNIPALVGPCKSTGNRSTLMARTMFFKLAAIESVKIKCGSSRGGSGPNLIQKPSTEQASDAVSWGGGGGLFSSPRGGSIAHDVSVLYMNPLHDGSSWVENAIKIPSYMQRRVGYAILEADEMYLFKVVRRFDNEMKSHERENTCDDVMIASKDTHLSARTRTRML